MTTYDLAPWMKVAESYLGTKEIAGPKNNPVILKFFREAGHPEIKDESTAWCSAFANAVMFESGIEGTKNLLARSWLTWKGGKRVVTPRFGDIAVFKRGNSSWQGHVAFFLRWDNDYVYILGGNQGSAGEVSQSRMPRSALLGFIRPLDVPSDPKMPKMTQKINYKPSGQDLLVTGGTAAALASNISGIMLALSLITLFGVLAYVIYERANA